MVGDPALIKELFTAKTELVARAGVLGESLGPGSTFSLDGAEHRERRKLLVPPFHGKRMVGYEAIVEEEVMREIASWPEGQEFETMPSMMRITLNAILRTVFGARGPRWTNCATCSRRWCCGLAAGGHAPGAAQGLRPVEPVAGNWPTIAGATTRSSPASSPTSAADPAFEERNDVLSLMLQARYEDGSQISDDHVADELLTLLAAGHETTATTLAWAVERLRRHPRLLSRLTAEVDAGGTELRPGDDLGGPADPARSSTAPSRIDASRECGWGSGSFPSATR